MMWPDVCAKYVGKRYNAASHNCRHLAAAAFTDLTGYDANSVFGTGENEGQFKKLKRGDFNRLKTPPSGLCVLILRDKHNKTHVALKNGMEVLHNLGAYSFGQVCLSRWETIRDEYEDFQYWVLK